tara:strand:+ start:249 stop:533 length:285 start_codon:yes stop_codon:yes gene_type:complete
VQEFALKNNLNQIKTNKLLKIVRDFIAQYQHQNQFEKASRLKQIMGRGYNQYTGGYGGYNGEHKEFSVIQEDVFREAAVSEIDGKSNTGYRVST